MGLVVVGRVHALEALLASCVPEVCNGRYLSTGPDSDQTPLLQLTRWFLQKHKVPGKEHSVLSRLSWPDTAKWMCFAQGHGARCVLCGTMGPDVCCVRGHRLGVCCLRGHRARCVQYVRCVVRSGPGGRETEGTRERREVSPCFYPNDVALQWFPKARSRGCQREGM